MMRKLFLILIIQLFVFCTSKNEHEYPRLIAPKTNKIIEVNSQHMLKSRPRLLGLNFIKDTTVVPYYNLYKNSIVNLGKDTLLPKYDLKIIIDTSYNFHYNDFEYVWLDLPKTMDSLLNLNLENTKFNELVDKVHYDKVDVFNKDHVKSYPILIYNNGNENSYIYDSPNGIQMIQEAKDIDGVWKPIEFMFNFPYSIIYYNFYELKPKNYLGTSIIKYHGDFKTKLRVKIKFGKYYYYSNEIVGYINRSQFETDFLNDYLKLSDYYIDEAQLKEKIDFSLLKTNF
jgi:hypothetical protein